MRIVSVIALCALLSGALSAQTLFVNASAPAGGDGSSWGAAFQDLDSALGLAQPGDDIWVAEGRYHPMAPAVTFQIPDGVGVYGGFDGTETQLSQRDWIAHPTYLDADVKGDDVLHRTADNVSRVVTLGTGGAPAILDGFIVRGARGGVDGGGLYIPGGSPTVAHCVFEDNRVSHGGAGVLVAGANMTFDDCTFSFNEAAIGGGLYIATGASAVTVTLNDCEFVGNKALQATPNDGDGGGLFAETNVDLILNRAIFLSNKAIPVLPNTISEGGGLCSLGGTVTVGHAIVQANTANLGGGIYVAGTLLASHVVASGNQVVDVNNLPGGRGGAIWAQTATLEGCTLAGNYAQKKAGGAVINNGDVRNSILWGNTVAPVPPGEDPPEPIQVQLAGGPNISYSDIQGLLTPLPGCPPPNPNDFPGSIEQDPMFADASVLSLFPTGTALRNLRLSPGSPCIDAADNGGFTLPVPMGDVNGKPRFHDDPATTNTGLGTGGIADMGAYEFGPWVSDLPMASFTSSLSVVTVTLTDTSTSVNGPMRLEIWNFGDGNGSCVPQAVHHFDSNGPRSVKLRVFDVALATAEGLPQTVLPTDTSPPAVTLTNPADGASVTGTVLIQAVATDNDVVDHVEFFVGTTSYGIDLEGHPIYDAPVPWDTTLVNDGFYTVKARAYDAVGNFAEATSTVHVVNQAPVFTSVPGPLDLTIQLGDSLDAAVRAMGLYPTTYALLSGPSGLQLQSQSSEGVLLWTPTAQDLGTHTAVVRASNASGIADVTLTLEVIPRVYLVETFDRPGFTNTTLTGLNDQGMMTGYTTQTGIGPRGFVTDGVTFTTIYAPTSFWTFAHDVNNQGVVCGSIYYVSSFSGSGWDTFTWQNGTFTTSIYGYYPPYSNEVDAYGINDAGLVVGRAFTGAYSPSAAWATFSPGVTFNPPGATLGVSPTGAYGCNDVDQVIGGFGLGTNNAIPGEIFVYDHPTDSYQVYSPPGAAGSTGRGINDSGLMCGVYVGGVPTASGLPSGIPSTNRAFVTLASQPGAGDWLKIYIPGALSTQALDINDAGVVVGNWYDANGISHGFIARPADSLQHADLGYGGPGNAHLSVTGYLGTGNTGSIDLVGAPPSTAAWLLASTQLNPTPFVGGTVVTVPVAAYFPLFTDSQGEIHIPGLPGGGGPLTVYLQYLHVLPSGPLGYGLSNAVEVQFTP